MTFNISAVAACCSRASFSAVSEPLERFDRVGEPTERLVLARIWPFAALALRFGAAFALPPGFDDRAISAPKGQ